MSKKNLILAAALSYKEEQMAPFVKSLAKINFKGDVVFLVSHNCPNETIQFLKQNHINTIRVQRFLRFIPSFLHKFRFSRKFSIFTKHLPLFSGSLPLFIRRKLVLASNQFFHHIALSRYAYYYKFLQSKRAQYECVLVTDVRDVIFQANPFEWKPESDINFFLEDKKYNIAIQNGIWVNGLYGSEILKKIGNNRVSCSGTTMGTVDAMLDYFGKMVEEQLKFIYKIASADGFDQGIHNYLIYTGKFTKFALINNFEGPVLTMHGMDESDIPLQENVIVFPLSKAPIPVLHQYDRFPAIDKLLKTKLE